MLRSFKTEVDPSEERKAKTLGEDGRTCADCRHFLGTDELCGRTVHRCRLTNELLSGEACAAFDVDLSRERICLNCAAFLGGGDWGLACSKHHHMLPQALTEACGDFEWSKPTERTNR